jgi:hypothetical protein
MGALLLMGLERNFKKWDKNMITMGVALIFSYLALYKRSPVRPGILLIQTILTLFSLEI